MKSVTLSNGFDIPQLGLGTFGMTSEELIDAICCSVEAGYRFFDTSDNYANDISVGKAINTCGIPREELIVESKIDNIYLKSGDIRSGYEKMLDRMKLDYVDILMFHWPFPGKFVNAWLELEKLYKETPIKAIGICNCKEHHIDDILKEAKVVPMINQIELHPKFTQQPVVDYCKKKNIQIMSYTPLARMDERLVKNEYLLKLSRKYEKTVPQIILRWNIEKGYVVIPKTQNPKRIKENIEIFDFALQNDEIEMIDNQNEDMRVRFDSDDLSRYK